MDSISPKALQAALQTITQDILIDVRSEAEYQREHVPGAHLLPLTEVSRQKVQALLPGGNGQVYVLCERGSRSRLAVEKLEHEGFAGAILVEGGTTAWIRAGLPVQRGRETAGISLVSLLALEAVVLLTGAALGYTYHYGFALLFAGLAVGIGAFADWRWPSQGTARQSTFG